MKRALLTLLLLFSLTHSSMTVFGQAADADQVAADDVEDEAPVPRVVRLSFVQGDVSFLRAGVTEWAAAVENLPLLAGDQIYAGQGARAELQLGRGSYVRLSESTALTITELLDTSAQFEVTEGVAIIRIERLAASFQRFEVDTPNAALVLQQDGLYRVNVRGEKESEVIVRNGGAEVSTLDGNFKVREGYRLIVDTNPAGRLEIAIDSSRDDWDQWSSDRDTTIDKGAIAAAPDYVNSYETTYSSFYGASDLSDYGTWTSDPTYGNCWRPRVAADWVPYRNGQWLWVPRVGWTWLSNEPWGWAPYHYGRWVFVTRFGWTWVPGFGSPYHSRYNHSYYRWRPALVRFFDSPTSRGHYVGWYPLTPGERWRRPDRDRRNNDHSHLQYPIARDGARRPGSGRDGIKPPSNGVTILPVDDFARPGRSRVRPGAPDKDLRDSISKGARPGLPEITPLPIAAAPALRDDGERKSRRIAIPPGEIISRPVVTRNRPVDSQTGVTAPRERRLISPRLPQLPADSSSRKKRGEEAGKDEENNKPAERVRAPRDLPTDAATGDGSASERKRKRDRDDSAERKSPEKNQGNDTNDSDGERHRKRPIFLPEPSPKEGNTSSDKPRDNENRSRSDDQEKKRERNDSASRPERSQPPSENKAERREERRQEKEERRQERREEREQRRKP